MVSKQRREELKARRASSTCYKEGMTACGAYGRESSSWDCVDTISDLESCKSVLCACSTLCGALLLTLSPVIQVVGVWSHMG